MKDDALQPSAGGREALRGEAGAGDAVPLWRLSLNGFRWTAAVLGAGVLMVIGAALIRMDKYPLEYIGGIALIYAGAHVSFTSVERLFGAYGAMWRSIRDDVAAIRWPRSRTREQLTEAERVMRSAAVLLSEGRNQLAYAQLFYYLHPPENGDESHGG